MAEFVNKCLLKDDCIHAQKDGCKVRYIISNIYNYKAKTKYGPLQELQYYLQTYDYSDIFILAPSVKSQNNPIRKFANYISDVLKIPIYIPMSDEEKLDMDVIKGKITFSTFHQVKGLERKVVMVFGFDDSYFKYYKTNHNVDICPNEIYLASTRATDILYVYHHYANGY